IPFIFGTIITLNMLEGTLFKTPPTPMKGIFSATSAAIIGTGLAWFFSALAGIVTGRLHA
ncbi:MAG TPA: hypothetical protein VK210_12485, partial [Terriglobia bacterium]|nr:hypothetical protein [Terriglobia bacterium]